MYRPVTFWSWNDDLQEEELIRQIGLMDEAGWGGFFMHARPGLETPYLSGRWFECVKACVTEARRRGMYAWIYDEDQWPSGFAGGIVPAQSPEYRAKALWCLVDDKPTHIAERLGAWIARRERGVLTDFQPAPDPTLYDPTTHAWVQIYPVTAELNQWRHKGYCYFDPLNPEAVQAFIESTYEAYGREVGQAFGETIPGVFTDEPQYLRWNWYQGSGEMEWYQGLGAHILPWTTDFPQEFEQRNGYSLLPELPCLFFDVGDYMRARYDFWRTMTLRFIDSFTRQVGEWCDTHRLLFTGHFLREDTLEDQILGSGAVMPHYEHMHIPGIDKLGRHIDQPLTAKQLDSVVCQLGKEGALCETYGCAGQDFSFADRKWIGDHLYALGVTLLNPHLSLYSMRGAAKRDFPPNLFYQQPWWPYNGQFDVYFTRLSQILSQGQRVVDVLVIHPIASAWTMYRPAALRKAKRLTQELRALSDSLLALHRDYHFADEILLAKHGSIEPGTIQVGKMRYRAVIVPPGTTLARTTVDLLQHFAAKGGLVIAAGEPPYLVDGRPAERVLPPETVRIPNERGSIAQALDSRLAPDLVIDGEGAEEVVYHHRRDGTREVFFLVNQDRYHGWEVKIRLPGTGRLEEWDPFTGKATPAPGRLMHGKTEVMLSFPPVGSHLLVMHTDQPAENHAFPRLSLPPKQEVTLPDRWAFRRLDPNAITLDHCSIGLDGEPWSRTKPVWQAQQQVATAGAGTPFALRFHFQAESVPRHIDLAFECPRRFQIEVNGRPAPYRESGHWRDISFKRVGIQPHVRAGRNAIELEGVFADDTVLENIYLIGDFGVRARPSGPERYQVNGMGFDRYAPEFTLIDEPREGSSQDLNQQGYPFYAGTLALCQVVEIPETASRAVLSLDGLHAIVADVWVNGQQAGVILVPPHQTDVISLLKPGPNEIEIRLVTSLRNALGPHHLAGGDPIRIWPHHYADESRWTDDYVLVPLGFERARLLVW